MFTGLVEGTGKIKNIRRIQDYMRLSVTPQVDVADCRTGDSISLDGVCLTVTEVANGSIQYGCFRRDPISDHLGAIETRRQREF